MGKKRLVVTCDGTWVDSDNGFVRDSWLPWKTGGHLATPSNVSRIGRALEPRSTDGVPQIVYYQAGLGSMNNWYSFFIGGYLGSGISENIREAYAFLCDNYEPGDEIFLLGFSRGAFTARSIGGLISSVGLLTRRGLDSFYPIYQDWQYQVDKHYVPKYGSKDWPLKRTSFNDPNYVATLVQSGLTRPNIPIKAIAVWDTVGTLGVPEIELLGIKFYRPNHKQYSFVNTEVGPTVEHAYQALALDEQRKSFAPTVWESPKPGAPSQLKTLRQCWFPGVHNSIGGSTQDTSIPDITLAWMITQLQQHLTFNPSYILEQQKLNKQFYTDHKFPVKPWAMGQIQQSDGGFLNTLLGRQVRTPGQYHAVDPVTGNPLRRFLVQTHEFMHPSVRYRIQQKGPGLATSKTSPGSGVYSPRALKGWKYYAAGEVWSAKGSNIDSQMTKWENRGKWVKDDGSVFIVEEPIESGTEEMELLDAWPGIAQKVVG